jgi:hypothetical protein
MEYRETIISIPASRAFNLSLVLSKEVISPAPMPEIKAIRVANQGLTPATIRVAATAPPIGKLPSTVRSGKESTRNVIYTPRATNPYAKPSYKEIDSKFITKSKRAYSFHDITLNIFLYL